jgi:hypothetical protein
VRFNKTVDSVATWLAVLRSSLASSPLPSSWDSALRGSGVVFRLSSVPDCHGLLSNLS